MADDRPSARTGRYGAAYLTLAVALLVAETFLLIGCTGIDPVYLIALPIAAFLSASLGLYRLNPWNARSALGNAAICVVLSAAVIATALWAAYWAGFERCFTF